MYIYFGEWILYTNNNINIIIIILEILCGVYIYTRIILLHYYYYYFYYFYYYYYLVYFVCVWVRWCECWLWTCICATTTTYNCIQISLLSLFYMNSCLYERKRVLIHKWDIRYDSLASGSSRDETQGSAPPTRSLTIIIVIISVAVGSALANNFWSIRIYQQRHSPMMTIRI